MGCFGEPHLAVVAESCVPILTIECLYIMHCRDAHGQPLPEIKNSGNPGLEKSRNREIQNLGNRGAGSRAIVYSLR